MPEAPATNMMELIERLRVANGKPVPVRGMSLILTHNAAFDLPPAPTRCAQGAAPARPASR